MVLQISLEGYFELLVAKGTVLAIDCSCANGWGSIHSIGFHTKEHTWECARLNCVYSRFNIIQFELLVVRGPVLQIDCSCTSGDEFIHSIGVHAKERIRKAGWLNCVYSSFNFLYIEHLVRRGPELAINYSSTGGNGFIHSTAVHAKVYTQGNETDSIVTVWCAIAQVKCIMRSIYN